MEIVGGHTGLRNRAKFFTVPVPKLVPVTFEIYQNQKQKMFAGS